MEKIEGKMLAKMDAWLEEMKACLKDDGLPSSDGALSRKREGQTR
jgi:hypothetical protein